MKIHCNERILRGCGKEREVTKLCIRVISAITNSPFQI